MKVLAVVPARGGSKGIPRKNIRPMGGRPLLHHVLDTLRQSNHVNDVIVTSDDERILEVAAEISQVFQHVRPQSLGADDVPLDPVVYDAVSAAEAATGQRYDIVVTVQPTSPLLSSRTLDAAIEAFAAGTEDSRISVVDDTHLRWGEQDGTIRPLYAARKNRQWLPKEYKETGSFVLTRRSVLQPDDRLGKQTTVHPVPAAEAIDVDDALDWLIAEALLQRLRIAFIAKGGPSLGLGHVYRTLTLADAVFGHHVLCLTVDSPDSLGRLYERRGHPHQSVQEDGLMAVLKEFAPDIVVNDTLDTETIYVQELQKIASFVVTFEDLGPGSLESDLTINALYEMSAPPATHLSGARYADLSYPFQIQPIQPLRPQAETLLVTFGGTDEANVTCNVLPLLPGLLERSPIRRVFVVLGPGYAHREQLDETLRSLPPETRQAVEVLHEVEDMARLMAQADVALTSNGRTVYELAAMGVPAVTVAQNGREATHLFARYSRGHVHLGLAAALEPQHIVDALMELATDQQRRQAMREALLEWDVRGGTQRVKDAILDGYWRKRHGATTTG